MPNWLFIAIAAVLIIAAFFFLAKRLLRLAAAFLILAFLAPTLALVLWGDGRACVAAFASWFPPEIEQTIVDGYNTYFEKNAEDPIVDLEQANSVFADAKDSVVRHVFGAGSP